MAVLNVKRGDPAMRFGSWQTGSDACGTIFCRDILSHLEPQACGQKFRRRATESELAAPPAATGLPCLITGYRQPGE